MTNLLVLSGLKNRLRKLLFDIKTPKIIGSVRLIKEAIILLIAE
jgi:hypothetical protein